MTQLRIGLIVYGSLDNCSGGYLYDRKIVEGLRHRGAEVDIVQLSRRSYGLQLTDNFSPALFRATRKHKWDALIQDELCHPSLLRFNRYCREAPSFPILSIVHHLRCCENHPSCVRPFYRALEKQYLIAVDGFILNSRTTGQAVKEILKSEFPAVVAYPGKDHLSAGTSNEAISTRCRNPGPLKLLFLGNVIQRKGLHTLMQALTDLPPGEWRLTIAGELSLEPGYVREIMKHIKKAHWRDSIRILGQVSHHELISALRDSHCLVMPSQYEGFGIAALEAMGFGQSVIASSAGAGPEWITDGHEGFLVPPESPAHLAERINTFIHDRTCLLSMSKNAFKKYTEHPTWDDAAGRVYEFVLKMVGRGSGLKSPA